MVSMSISAVLSFALLFEAAHSFHVISVSPVVPRLVSRPPFNLFGKKERFLADELERRLAEEAGIAPPPKKKPSAAATPPAQRAEFSRRVRIESVLGGGRTKHSETIEATPDERKALTARFRYGDIPRLSASISLSKDSTAASMAGRRAPGGQVVRVDGSVDCALTRTCVRTLEEFTEDLVFDFSAVVRTSGKRDDTGRIKEANEGKNRGERRKGKGRGGRQKIDLGSVEAGAGADAVDEGPTLQEMIDEVQEERDDVIEDPEIYGEDGQLDVGELVAQYVSLTADPNPKKPGSKPVVQTWVF
eukprot:CAMPEP_0194266728 /NCGR_PEP_ID=MMETSP0169-20130528/1543_1 /TAXON_ID=218684 /ORGANISM="Corethron pennatum, Strain L29A3" /LENGTH=302 /DNA_ID=CAMNT_0039007483 /DNA_START=90 /DNA_END=998 /DNA_ORIENTATION=-